MKIRSIKKICLFILLGLLCVSCSEPDKGKITFNVTWDKNEIYINETTNMKVDTNLPYEVTNLTENILEVNKKEDGNYEIKGIGIGEGQISVSAGGKNQTIVVIRINEIPVQDTFSVECTKPVIYIDETTNINVDTNLEYEVINLTTGILEVLKKENGVVEVKGIGVGNGQIEIKSGEKYKETIDITVINYPMPTSLNLKIVENGPYYYGETYHLAISLEPSNALNNVELNYNRNYMTINEETMEVTFNKAGEFYISCYSMDNFELEVKIDFEVIYNPEVELYRILFVGNSFTKHNYDIPKLVEGMMKQEGLDVECEGSIAGGKALVDQRSKVESKLRSFRYTHVVLQEHSYGPIEKYNQFESTVLALAKAIEENKAKIHLYQTWAYDKDVWNGITRSEMTKKLVEAYGAVAEKVEATINPVGMAFEKYYLRGDLPSLYCDMSHPSVYGAFLSACVHYSSITGKKASDNQYKMEEIDDNMTQIIKEIADEVVFG